MARSGALAPFFLGTFAHNANKSDRHISMIISRGDWKLFPLHNTLANDAAEKASAEAAPRRNFSGKILCSGSLIGEIWRAATLLLLRALFAWTHHPAYITQTTAFCKSKPNWHSSPKKIAPPFVHNQLIKSPAFLAAA